MNANGISPVVTNAPHQAESLSAAWAIVTSANVSSANVYTGVSCRRSNGSAALQVRAERTTTTTKSAA